MDQQIVVSFTPPEGLFLRHTQPLRPAICSADERFPVGDVPERDFEQKFLPEKSAPFVLLGVRPWAYVNAWGHLWDYLTTEKWLLRPDLSG